MAWLKVFNGIAAPLSNSPSYEEIEEVENDLDDLRNETGLEIEVRDNGGLMVYAKNRSLSTTVYKPGDADEFSESWLGTGALSDSVIYPFSLSATPLNDNERDACLSAAQKTLDILKSVAPGVEADDFHYGFHIYCFD